MTTMKPIHDPRGHWAEAGGFPQPLELDADAVIYEFMTAGGNNPPTVVTDLLADDPTGERYFAEMTDEWVLWVPIGDLREALRRFIETRPDAEAA